MCQYQTDLSESVVNVVIAKLQEGEKDSIDQEHSNPFKKHSVFELFLQHLGAPYSRIFEPVYFRDTK